MGRLGHIARVGNGNFITKCNGKTEAGVKVKVQYTLQQAMKAQRGSRG
jgi:hypothetical protein